MFLIRMVILFIIVVKEIIPLVKMELLYNVKLGSEMNKKTFFFKLNLSFLNRNAIGVAKELLTMKADVNCKNKSGRTPLHIAAQKGNAELVKILLSFGANKTIKDNLGMTPLNFAEGNLTIKQLLG